MHYPLKHYDNLEQPWDIFCDFDGTITFFDVTDSLLERFARPGWKVIEQEWEQGLIGSRECLDRQIQLLDMTHNELDHHLSQVEIDPDFVAFVEVTQARGYPMMIVSDGLDYSIRHILNRYNITGLPIFANQLHPIGKRSWKLTFPNFNKACGFASGHCKCATMNRVQLPVVNQRRTLLIGDGRSDFCAAEEADFVFAKHKLTGHCIEQNLPHYAIQSFADAIRLLEHLDHNKPSKQTVIH